ncbi:hypothetical protein FLJU110815_01390 [Flavobacterium jumunjinense]|nr:hypothetical protein [Flavobacterium jumunjinense]
MSFNKPAFFKLTMSALFLIFLGLVTFGNNQSKEEVYKTVAVFENTTVSLDNNHYLILESNDDSISFRESEIELELEIETFLFQKSIYSFETLSTVLKNECYYCTHFYTEQSIPLYDLFCNWKLHLS